VSASLLDKWLLLMEMAADPNLQPGDVVFAMIILNHGDVCYRSQEGLAALMRETPRHIRRRTERLRPYFEITESRGRGNAITYVGRYKTRTQPSAFDDETRTHKSGFEDGKADTEVQKGGHTGPKTRTPVSPHSSNDSANESSKAAAPVSDDVKIAVEGWNALAGRKALQKVAKLTGTRLRHLQARLRDAGGVEGWDIALQKIEQTPGLTAGRGRSGWKASFDWLVTDTGFTKLMEGAYDNWGASKPGAERGSALAVHDALMLEDA
jgi:hypothetical protein